MTPQMDAWIDRKRKLALRTKSPPLSEKRCPVCRGRLDLHPAISRRDNKTKICTRCGQREALQDWSNGVKVSQISVTTPTQTQVWSNTWQAQYSLAGGTGATVIVNSATLFSASSTTNVATNFGDIYEVADPGVFLKSKDGLALIADHEQRFKLPDGSVLEVDAMGNFHIDDTNAKVVYQASRVREFNPYLNASDQLVRFIEYVGRLGLRRQEAASLPLSLFVNWLIIEAAEKDRDPIPDGVSLLPQHPDLRKRLRPRCLVCHRFVKRSLALQGFSYCTPEHAIAYARRLAA